MIYLHEVVISPEKSTASKIGSLLYESLDYIPFAGSIKQVAVGIHHGSWIEAGLGVGMLAVDVFTAGEGGEVIRLAEVAIEDALKIAVENEIKEGAEKALEEAVIHGNSAEAKGAQHAYDIVDTHTGEVVKTGISGGKETAGGLSVRAQKQVRAFNKTSPGRYKSVITHRVPAGPDARKTILAYEKARAATLRAAGELRGGFHVRP